MTAPVEQLQLVPACTCRPGIHDRLCPIHGEIHQPIGSDSQLEMLPEWDGTLPVPYNVVPY